MLGDGRLDTAVRAVALLRGAFSGLEGDLSAAAKSLAGLDPKECDKLFLKWDIEDTAAEWNEILQDARSFETLVCRG